MLTLIAPVLFALAQAPAPVPTPAPEPTPQPAWSGPVVVIETSVGRIKVGLDKQKAPLSVDNFIKYVRAGHYDSTLFHRVIPNFMIQGGGFEADMTQRPTRPPVKNESKNGRRNLRGTLAMARTNDPHSATAQFFINVKDNAFLDFGVARDGWGYAVFGEVLEGMEIVDKIAGVPTTTKGVYPNVPQVPVVIKRVRESK